MYLMNIKKLMVMIGLQEMDTNKRLTSNMFFLWLLFDLKNK